MRVAIIGGTGFVGSYLVDALTERGHEPSLLVRPGSVDKVRHVARCRVTEGDLASEAQIRAALDGCDAVIYNVGILREQRAAGVTFENTQYEGVVRTLKAVKNAHIRRFLLMSANGIRRPGTRYQETKFRAEEALRGSGLDYTIFRPSVIFGDPRGTMEFATQLYQDMVRPPLPAVSFYTGWRPGTGQVLMSPVHVADVADAFLFALEHESTAGMTYRLGGPEVLSWTEMVKRIGLATGKNKLILPMPIAVMMVAATLLDWLPLFPVTRDQLTMLAEGNTVDPDTLQSLIHRAPRMFSVENLGYLRAGR